MIDKEKIAIFCFILLCSLFNTLQSDINWSAPVTISSTNFNASSPQIVIDSQGNATAAWVENNTIVAGTLPYKGSWSTPVTISNALNTASDLSLGVDATGNVTALWIENSIIETAILPLGGSWSIATPISSSGASSPCLAVDANGNAVAVWARNGAIESSTGYLGVWDSVLTLSASASDHPQVAISKNGTVIAVWHKIVSGADALMSSRKTLGSSWNSAINVFSRPPSLHHNYPKVALDMNGNALLVWFRYYHYNGVYQRVSVLTSSLPADASSWSMPPTNLSSSGIRNPADLALNVVFDPNGNAFVLWTNSYDGQLFFIESITASFGKSWNGIVMPYSPSIYSLDTSIAVNALGVLITYMNWDGSLLKIQSQESDMASPIVNSWTPTNLVSQGSNNGYPRCALTLTENISTAVVVWINFNGTNSVIQASVGSKGEILPPTNLNVTQNMTDFGVYKDFFNTIAWQASSSPNIVQYNIFRNGVFFGSTASSILQIRDRNATQNGSVTYGVAALDNQYSQSTIATIDFP